MISMLNLSPHHKDMTRSIRPPFRTRQPVVSSSPGSFALEIDSQYLLDIRIGGANSSFDAVKFYRYTFQKSISLPVLHFVALSPCCLKYRGPDQLSSISY
jgi:hypothetical protein